MNDDPAKTLETREATVIQDRRFVRQAVTAVIVAAVVFLMGFVPMWFKAGSRAKERDAAQHELHLARMQLALASAAIDARRGEYEAARLSAVSFFTNLTVAIHPGDNLALAPAQRDAVQLLLQERDDLVTLLARSDPASAERLANLYVAYRKAVGR